MIWGAVRLFLSLSGVLVYCIALIPCLNGGGLLHVELLALVCLEIYLEFDGCTFSIYSYCIGSLYTGCASLCLWCWSDWTSMSLTLTTSVTNVSVSLLTLSEFSWATYNVESCDLTKVISDSKFDKSLSSFALSASLWISACSRFCLRLSPSPSLH